MSLTDAIKEAYAEPDLDDVIYDVLILDHPAFDAPQRFVCNVENDMTLGGNLHTAIGVSIVLVGFDDDGQTQGQITLENVSSLLVPHLKAAVQAGSPIQVTYQGWLASISGTPQEVRGGMILSKVSLNATTASGVLEGASKHDTQAFPRLVYSTDKYKALNGVS